MAGLSATAPYVFIKLDQYLKAVTRENTLQRYQSTTRHFELKVRGICKEVGISTSNC